MFDEIIIEKIKKAQDQLRGEASTLSFFSNGQYQNPMVIRIASLAYQKGFGGHFHNDAQRESAANNVREWWKEARGKAQAEGIRVQLKLFPQNTTLAGRGSYFC